MPNVARQKTQKEIKLLESCVDVVINISRRPFNFIPLSGDDRNRVKLCIETYASCEIMNHMLRDEQDYVVHDKLKNISRFDEMVDASPNATQMVFRPKQNINQKENDLYVFFLQDEEKI